MRTSQRFRAGTSIRLRVVREQTYIYMHTYNHTYLEYGEQNTIVHVPIRLQHIQTYIHNYDHMHTCLSVREQTYMHTCKHIIGHKSLHVDCV